MALISEETVAIVEGVAAEAQRIETRGGWGVGGGGARRPSPQSRGIDDRRPVEGRRARGLYPVAERAARPSEKPKVFARGHPRPRLASRDLADGRHLGRARCDRLSTS